VLAATESLGWLCSLCSLSGIDWVGPLGNKQTDQAHTLCWDRMSLMRLTIQPSSHLRGSHDWPRLCSTTTSKRAAQHLMTRRPVGIGRAEASLAHQTARRSSSLLAAETTLQEEKKRNKKANTGDRSGDRRLCHPCHLLKDERQESCESGRVGNGSFASENRSPEQKRGKRGALRYVTLSCLTSGWLLLLMYDT
jgi:hypothetical protein